MHCSEIQEKLSAFYDGALRETEGAAIEAHLRECAECQRELTSLQTTSRLLQVWEAPKISPRVQRAFIAKLEERAARQPWWATLFVGWQKQVAWATAAAAVLMVVALNVKRPTPNPIDENASGHPYVAAQPKSGNAGTPDRLTTKSEAEAQPHRSHEEKLALETESKSTPPMSAPPATSVSDNRLSKKKQRPSHRADEVLIAKISVPSSVALERDALRPSPEGVSSKAAADVLARDEKNALLVLNVTPPPAEEAANYIRAIMAEVAEPVSVELVDATTAAYIEKRPERMLTDWMTETGD